MATWSRFIALSFACATALTGVARAEDKAKPANVAKVAALEEPKPQTPDRSWEKAKATRRSGFLVGLTIGAGVTSIAGYPNDAKLIGKASAYTETGARPGGMGLLWLGGAITDYLNFGVGFGGGQLFFPGAGDKAQSFSLSFRAEVFPLFPLGGKLRDLGIFFEGGTGPVSVADKDDKKLVDGALCSYFGGGAFYEAFRLWRFAMGPVLAGNYMWSSTARRPGLFIGFRTVLYTGP